jgi:hypothetical protein
MIIKTITSFPSGGDPCAGVAFAPVLVFDLGIAKKKRPSSSKPLCKWNLFTKKMYFHRRIVLEQAAAAHSAENTENMFVILPLKHSNLWLTQ